MKDAEISEKRAQLRASLASGKPLARQDVDDQVRKDYAYDEARPDLTKDEAMDLDDEVCSSDLGLAVVPLILDWERAVCRHTLSLQAFPSIHPVVEGRYTLVTYINTQNSTQSFPGSGTLRLS